MRFISYRTRSQSRTARAHRGYDLWRTSYTFHTGRFWTSRIWGYGIHSTSILVWGRLGTLVLYAEWCCVRTESCGSFRLRKQEQETSYGSCAFVKSMNVDRLWVLYLCCFEWFCWGKSYTFHTECFWTSRIRSYSIHSTPYQSQICNGVPRQFRSCLKWRSRAYKPRREGCSLEDKDEFSVDNPGALFRKSVSNNIDFRNSTPGVVYGKLRYLWFWVILLRVWWKSSVWNSHEVVLTC